MVSDKQPRPAYVVDIDERSGKTVRGSRRNASTKEPKPHRESRSDKSRRRTVDVEQVSERVTHGSSERKGDVITTEKEVKQERRKSSSSSTHSPRKSARPPSAHKNQAFPKLHTSGLSKPDDPRHYGISPQSRTMPIPIVSQQQTPPVIAPRPRAVTTQTYPRPVSYHAPYPNYVQGPPLSSSAYYQTNQTPQIVTPSYPPPSPSYMRYATTPAPPASDYFGSQAMSAPERPGSARPLAHRFDTPSRTSSGFGMYEAPQQDMPEAYDSSYYNDGGYASASEGTARRRESIRVPSKTTNRLSKTAADYAAMPPPPRPILRRPQTEYASESLDPYRAERDGRTLIRDDSRPRRPSSHRNSVSYDIADGMERVRLETANHGRRRASYYGQQTSASGSSGYEDKLRHANSYLDDVSGPSVPLTADLLKRQQRRQGGSSRSTKSSASRDESDYRKSATTRTTRSGSGGDDENVTIKVTGGARVMVSGAQIDCPEGGEIEIRRQQKQLRNGSERSNSEYGGPPRIDDRRSRLDRPSGRSRMSSQNSHTRSKQYYSEGRDGGWI